MKPWRIFQRKRENALPDLSRQCMSADIPLKQRNLVDQQLRDMYEGRAVPHFAVIRDVFSRIEATPLRLLDAGCASGYYSEILRYMATQSIDYMGSDYNGAMVQMAKRYYPDLPFARMDIRSLGWKDASFDAVLSSAVLAHVREWQKALSELMRVTRKWLILHRTWVNLRGKTRIEVRREYDVDVYRVYIQRSELFAWLSRGGFDLAFGMECYEGPSGGGDTQDLTFLFVKKDSAKKC
jgi:SAM-dependent methyltransferase